MEFWLFGLVFALIGGLLISVLNYFLSCWLIKKNETFVTYSSSIRQIINIIYLVALYFISPHTLWAGKYLLIGGVIGITVGMLFILKKLMSFSGGIKSDENTENNENDKNNNEKEEN